MIPKDLLVYESYIDGKMTKKTRAKECLEWVHIDMYGYFITFSDDYSRFGYVHRKSDALETFIEFKVGSDNLLGLHTNLLWLDQGDMSSKFDSLLYWKMEKWKKKYQT